VVFNTEVKLAGVRFKNKGGKKRQDLLGLLYDEYWTEDLEDEIKLELRSEPENPVDPNAVAVWCTAPKDAVGKLGFIPGEQAEFVGDNMKKNRVRSVRFSDMGCAGRHALVYARLELRMLGGEESPEDQDEDNTVEDEDGNVYDL